MTGAIASVGYYILWGRSSTIKGGDRSVDKHQPFNPMLRSIDFPDSMKYVITQVTTCDKLYPNIEFDKELAEGTVRFTCHFRDPMMLATLFTYKGLPTTWTGSGDVMTFNFSTLANRDKNIWVQLHEHDQSGNSNHLDVFLDGGELISHKIIIEVGEPIIEEFEIKFAEINVATETDSTGAYICDMDDGFDDGSFDQTGVAEITSITCIAKAGISDGDYFKLWAANGTGGWTAYYVWMDTTGGSVTDPAPSGFTSVRCDISGDTTAAQVATTVAAAINGLSGFAASASDEVITATAASEGDVKDCVDVNAGFTISVTTQGVTALDGGWSNWDGAYTSTKCAMSNDVTITFGGASFADIGIQGLEIEMNVPKEAWRVQSSLMVQDRYLGKRGPWKVSIRGILLKGNVNAAEPSTVIASKTTGTLKVQYGTTKYLQFTNAYTEGFTGDGMEAGSAKSATFAQQGGADSVLTYSWTADEATDPSNHINHTDVP